MAQASYPTVFEEIFGARAFLGKVAQYVCTVVIVRVVVLRLVIFIRVPPLPSLSPGPQVAWEFWKVVAQEFRPATARQSNQSLGLETEERDLLLSSHLRLVTKCGSYNVELSTLTGYEAQARTGSFSVKCFSGSGRGLAPLEPLPKFTKVSGEGVSQGRQQSGVLRAGKGDNVESLVSGGDGDHSGGMGGIGGDADGDNADNDPSPFVPAAGLSAFWVRWVYRFHITKLLILKWMMLNALRDVEIRDSLYTERSWCHSRSNLDKCNKGTRISTWLLTQTLQKHVLATRDRPHQSV